MDIPVDTEDEHFVMENDTNYNLQLDGLLYLCTYQCCPILYVDMRTGFDKEI